MEKSYSICSVVDSANRQAQVNGYYLAFNLGDSTLESEKEFYSIAKDLADNLGWLGPFALLAMTEDSEGNWTEEVLDVVDFH